MYAARRVGKGALCAVPTQQGRAVRARFALPTLPLIHSIENRSKANPACERAVLSLAAVECEKYQFAEPLGIALAAAGRSDNHEGKRFR